MSDLNLLPNVAKFQANKMKLKRLARDVSMGVGGVWLLVVIVTYSLWMYSQQNKSSEAKKYNQANSAFMSMQQEIMLTQDLKYKAKLVGEMLGDRFEYSEAFEVINNLFSDKVKLTRSQIQPGKLIDLRGEMEDIRAFSEVEDKIKQVAAKKVPGLSSIDVSNLDLDQGGWKFDMEVTVE